MAVCDGAKLINATEEVIDCVDNILGDADVDETILLDSGHSYNDLYFIQSKVAAQEPPVNVSVSPTVYGRQYL